MVDIRVEIATLEKIERVSERGQILEVLSVETYDAEDPSFGSRAISWSYLVTEDGIITGTYPTYEEAWEAYADRVRALVIYEQQRLKRLVDSL